MRGSIGAAVAAAALALLACRSSGSGRSSGVGAPGPNRVAGDGRPGPGASADGRTPQSPPPRVRPPSTGFTALPRPESGESCPSSGPERACAVYVDPDTGADSNHGRTPDAPKATIPAAYEALRPDSADQLLLRRGRRFEAKTFVVWAKSGHSAEHPIVLGAYGEGPRPIVHPDQRDGLHISPGFRSDQTVRHLAIVGIHFQGKNRDPNAPGFDPDQEIDAAISVVGVQTTAPVLVEDLLIEDCKVTFFGAGIAIDGEQGVRNVRLRRNVLVDNYTRTIGNGIYLDAAHDVLVEENLIDKTKWEQLPDLYPNALDHSIYVQTNTSNITIRRNIMARGFDGAMQRSGGAFQDNVVYRTSIGNHQGYIFGGTTPIPGGVEFRTEGNAFLHIGGPKGGVGRGVQAGNIKSGVVRDNIFATNDLAESAAVRLLGTRDLGNAGVLSLEIANNRVLQAGHEVQRVGNTFGTIDTEPMQPGKPPAGDLLAAYNASLGGPASAEAFLSQAAEQSAQNWREEYTAVAILAWLEAQGYGPTGS